jgi:uncharacterized RDD family membrane protein YckC
MAAHFGRRAAAYLIDVAIIAGLLRLSISLHGPLTAPLRRLFGIGLQDGQATDPAGWLWLWYGTMLPCLYFVYPIACEWLCGATMGKLLLRMRVAGLDGRPCTMVSALVRGVLRPFDQLVFGLIAYINMQVNPRLQQRLGDQVARTVVVDRRDPFLYRLRSPWLLAVALIACGVLLQMGTVIDASGASQAILAAFVLPTSRTAAEVNLQAADFSPALVLNNESTRADYPDFGGTDISGRFFVGEDLAVDSRVKYFGLRPTDTFDETMAAVEKYLRKEFEGDTLAFDPTQEIPLGDRGAVRRFANTTVASEGYVLCFFRGKAYVRIIFYGDPGRVTSDQAAALAGIIDGRMTQGRSGTR